MHELLPVVAFAHLLYSPYTKVEESFNIQAMHDIIYHRFNFSEYDHKEFPGVVPRTFIGPLFISLLSSPIVVIFSVLGFNKFWSQYIVRAILGMCVISTFLRFVRSLESYFGKPLSKWYLFVTISQYHFMYYLSRPLPNIMTMPLVLLALHSWLRRNQKNFIIFSGASIIWFRGELALYFGTILLFELYYGSLTLTRLIKIAVPAGLVLLLTTILIDSVFWGRFVWPEGEVLWFNTVLNKSGEWGTSPFFWYFYSAIPRGMAFSVFLIPLGACYDSRVLKLISPAVIFIFLYSFLPHKELRFIIYAFPLLNVAAASICHRAWENRHKSKIHKLFALGMAGHIALNFLFTIFLLMIAGVNYPGGVAMARIHRLASSKDNVSLHIDNLSAQTGASRFSEINPNWRYSKKENLMRGSPEIFEYTHLLVEAKSKYSLNLKPYQKSHEILESVDGFSQILLNYNIFPPIRIKTKPMIFILKRKDDGIFKRKIEIKNDKLEEGELFGKPQKEEMEEAEEERRSRRENLEREKEFPRGPQKERFEEFLKSKSEDQEPFRNLHKEKLEGEIFKEAQKHRLEEGELFKKHQKEKVEVAEVKKKPQREKLEEELVRKSHSEKFDETELLRKVHKERLEEDLVKQVQKEKSKEIFRKLHKEKLEGELGRKAHKESLEEVESFRKVQEELIRNPPLEKLEEEVLRKVQEEDLTSTAQEIPQKEILNELKESSMETKPKVEEHLDIELQQFGNEIFDHDTMTEIDQLKEYLSRNDEEAQKVKESIKNILQEVKLHATQEEVGAGNSGMTMENETSRKINSLPSTRSGNESESVEPEKDLEEALSISRESVIGNDGALKHHLGEGKKQKRKFKKVAKEEKTKKDVVKEESPKTGR